MNKKIGIVVDSTSGIKNGDYEGVTMIPLSFIFGDETYLDGVDLNAKEFFEVSDRHFQKDKTLPMTSQPSIGKTIEVFEELLNEYEELIYITLSSKMSGTYQAGVVAAREFSNKVHVIDTELVSKLVEDLVIFALPLVEKGLSAAEIIEHIEATKKNFNVFFAVDTLEHLNRMGRISATSKTIGTLLKLKPMLSIVDGEVVSIEKIRTTKKAHDAIFTKIKSLDIKDSTIITILSGDSDDYCEAMRERLLAQYPHKQIEIKEISPVVCVNTGPGVLGVSITDYEL